MSLDETFAPCSFAWFMIIKFEPNTERSFYDLIRPSFLVLVYGYNFQQWNFL